MTEKEKLEALLEEKTKKLYSVLSFAILNPEISALYAEIEELKKKISQMN